MENIVEIQEEVRIPQKDHELILEKGDKIEILKEYKEGSKILTPEIVFSVENKLEFLIEILEIIIKENYDINYQQNFLKNTLRNTSEILKNFRKSETVFHKR